MPSKTAVTGKNFTLTCVVISDWPTVISWETTNGDNVNGKGIVVSSKYVDGRKRSVKLHFDFLLASHAGMYVCNSQMNISSPKNASSQRILLEVDSKLQFTFISSIHYSVLLCWFLQLLPLL